MSKTINLGAVTAYADAVAAGYTGTREEFAQDLANAATYAAESHASAETASAAAETASTAATTATTAASSASDDASTAHSDAEAALSFKAAAETAAGTATTKAGEAANSASQAATSASGAAGSATAASGSATAAAGSATNAAASETAAAGSATAAAGSASAAAQTLVDVNAAGATQIAAIAAKGEEVLESIPADYTELSQDVDDLKSDLNIVVESSTNWNTVALTLSDGYYSYVTGDYTSDSERRSAKIDVSVGQKYKLSTYTRPATISGIVYFDSNNDVAGHLLDGTGTGTLITDYVFTIPVGVASMAVQSGDKVQAVPQLSLEVTEREFVGYTKSEINGMVAGVPKKYGFRYSLTDPDDLGERVFDAVGLNATIGVGSTNGASDFDSIYPWSEMKRCNINKNANGAEVVTFEGETGFALDGSNGDVFVRIPKFRYTRYKSNGYEYHVISESEGNVHPDFVENGAELDEIFVGAFEAYSDGAKLHSYGGVIPSSNMLGSEFLSLAKANGNRYTLYDMRSMSAIWVLMAVEYGCRNTNQIIGYGFADFVQPVSGTYGIDYDGEATTTNVFTCPASLPALRMASLLVGSNVNICNGSQANVIASRKLTARTSDSSHYYLTFDGDPVALDSTCFIGSAACTTNFCETVDTGALSWHTGRANWVSGSTTKNPVRYRWIENIVGSLWHIFPDIIFNDLQMYVCNDMSKYNLSELDPNYIAIGNLMTMQNDNGNKSDITDANYWIDELTNDYFAKTNVLYGKTWDKSLVSTKAFGAYYYLNTGLRLVTNGGGFDHLYRCNMLTNRAWSNLTSDKWYLYGARLLYKHI